jgi:hypothetical protein
LTKNRRSPDKLFFLKAVGGYYAFAAFFRAAQRFLAKNDNRFRVAGDM